MITYLCRVRYVAPPRGYAHESHLNLSVRPGLEEVDFFERVALRGGRAHERTRDRTPEMVYTARRRARRQFE